MSTLACVTGRFQPVHHQHLELFEIALREADHLVVAVTNPDTGARREESTSDHRHLDEANPFTYFQRARMLNAVLDARATVVPFDLTRPEFWPEYVPRQATQLVRAYSDWERHKAEMLRGGGYPVRLIEGDPDGRISGSEIRSRIAGGGEWRALVPDAVAGLMAEFSP